MRRQRDVGEKLKREVLLPILGAADYSFFNSEYVFGAANRRLRVRVPLVLAFGFETGTAFYSLQDRRQKHRREAGNLCAIFNLGISLFDLIYDNFPAMARELSQWFIERQSISPLPTARSPLADSSSTGSQTTEVRLLTTLINWFFDQLESAANISRNTDVYQRVTRHLFEAYHAEMNSAPASQGSASTAVRISQAKSTLPFIIITELSSLFVVQPRSGVAPLVRSLTRHLAANFWLTDDLVDIIDDARAGALNSIVCRAKSDLNRDQHDKDKKGLLRQLLEKDYIQKSAVRIAHHNSRVSRILRSPRLPRHPAGRLRRVVRSYTRDWLE